MSEPVKEAQGDTSQPSEKAPEEIAPTSVGVRGGLQQSDIDALYGARKTKEGGADAPHVFWDKQPVPRLGDVVTEFGPIETKTVDQVRKEPLDIASVFEWWVPDLHKPDELRQVYELLTNNYVEDDDALFRFNYSSAFLLWAMTPPGYYPDWHVAVRKKSDKQLLAFISGIPLCVRLGERPPSVICEINFLCIHKKLREKRMAPILISEVTRRVNLQDIWQAVYTAGKVLPRPFTSAQYFHRSLNPEKLVAIGFSRIPQQFQRFQNPMEMLKRHYQLKAQTTTKLRLMEPKDIPAVKELLNKYLSKFEISAVFDDRGVAHWMLPREGVLYSYVRECPDTGRPTDFVSFYALPSTVIGNTKYPLLNAAYSYYYASSEVKPEVLMADALILAKNAKFDVFNTVSILDNQSWLEPLKFGPGDGRLQYYLYNYKYPELPPARVGLVML